MTEAVQSGRPRFCRDHRGNDAERENAGEVTAGFADGFLKWDLAAVALFG